MLERYVHKMILTLKRFVYSQQYNPGFLGLFLNPFYHSRRGLYRAVLSCSSQFCGRLLDVGCGSKPYKALFRVEEYVGLEFDTPENRQNKQAEFFYDGNIFPIPDQSFDSVICNQVLEHVFTPDQFLAEIFRVLKPDGIMLLTVPFVWDEHEQPFDYARYSSFGLKSLLEKNGFEVFAQQKINADVRVLFQLINAYLFKVLWTRWSLINLLICVVVMAPFNVLGSLLYRLLPGNADLYLDQLVLVRKGLK